MKRAANRVCFVAFMLSVSILPSHAQVAYGIQHYGSFGGGPFDTLNLGNLNVHFSVPILHKAGRGLPFNYALNYDSSIYQIVTSGGNQYWKPVTQIGGVASYWGWTGLGPVFTPYVGYSVTTQTGQCGYIYSQYTWTLY